MSRRKYKFYRRRDLVKQLQGSHVGTIHFDDAQMQALIDSVSQCISCASNKSVEDLSNILNKEKPQRDDSFSLVVKGVLSGTFLCLGLVLFGAIISEWNTIWVGGLQNFGVVIVLIYCLIFIALGIDVWFEKDRNYLISIFSSLVSFVALAITVFEKL